MNLQFDPTICDLAASVVSVNEQGAIVAAEEHLTALIDLVQAKSYVTYVELRNELQRRGFDTGGDYLMELPGKNVILWVGMSRAFVDLVERLQDDERVEVRPSQYLAYWIDGTTLNFPLANRVPANGYKSLHWLPVCFSTNDYQ